MTDDTAKRAREEAERLVRVVNGWHVGIPARTQAAVAAYIEELMRERDKWQEDARLRAINTEQSQAKLADAQRERDAARGEAANLYLRLNNVVECDLRMTRADLADAQREIERLKAELVEPQLARSEGLNSIAPDWEKAWHACDKERAAALAEIDALKAEAQEQYNLRGAQTLELRKERDALRRALAFFRSVIQSGETWTDECERTYRAALEQK